MTRRYYRDQQAWRDLQRFLPERLRLTPAGEPREEFWDWRGHRVHLDRYDNAEANAKVVLLHGVGTNGRQMSLILGAELARHGFETIAVDNLGYGMTSVAEGVTHSYDDWVDLVVDLVAAERRRDQRPIVLYGLSAGGMLTYHAAAKAPKGDVRAIIGMCYFDVRDQVVRDTTARDIVTARIGVPLMGLLNRTPLARLRLPMRLVAKMNTLVNDPAALKVFLSDHTSARNSASLRFLATYSTYQPCLEPEDFDRCPILLTQPAADRWTPLSLSSRFLERITKVPVTTVMLDNAGHFPVEQPGLDQMHNAITEFLAMHTTEPSPKAT